MLPPLLGLLLDCAQKTDQSVVAISLGALVHLIEVGGHQFSYNDWDTLLESIRCKFNFIVFSFVILSHWLFYSDDIVDLFCLRNASYATQPLELLNDLGFENSKHHTTVVRNKIICWLWIPNFHLYWVVLDI